MRHLEKGRFKRWNWPQKKCMGGSLPWSRKGVRNCWWAPVAREAQLEAVASLSYLPTFWSGQTDTVSLRYSRGSGTTGKGTVIELEETVGVIWTPSRNSETAQEWSFHGGGGARDSTRLWPNPGWGSSDYTASEGDCKPPPPSQYCCSLKWK